MNRPGSAFGKGGASPVRPWYESWQQARSLLSDMHAVSTGKANGAVDVAERLRQLFRNPHGHSPEIEGRGALARGGALYVSISRALSSLIPDLPLNAGDEKALALLWWWAWACLGLSRSQLLALSQNAKVVTADGARRITYATIDGRMWRSGPIPPVRGGAPAALEQLTNVVLAAAAHPDLAAFEDEWIGLAVARLRLLEPGTCALLAMLAHVAPEPFPVSDLQSAHTDLAPVALADTCSSAASIRAAVATLNTLGLTAGTPKDLVLPVDTRERVRDVLTPIERRFGAEAAVSGVELALFPAFTQNPATWPRARAMRAHALVAAAESEKVDVGEGARAYLLERLCIFEREHGRLEQAIDAGRRALRDAERIRLDDETLAGILVNLGDALGHARRFEEGEEHFRRALRLDELDPVEHAKTLNMYAAFLRLARRPNEALQRHREAIRLLRSEDEPQVLAEVLHDTSLALTALRRYASALRVLRCAQEIAPRDSDVSLLVPVRISETLTKLRRYSDALTTAQSALPALEQAYGRRSGPYTDALHAEGAAVQALADRGGDKNLKLSVKKKYRAYRLLKEDLEANPEDAPGLSDEV